MVLDGRQERQSLESAHLRDGWTDSGGRTRVLLLDSARVLLLTALHIVCK